MKNDLTCGVVRDLLPSYAEGLLGEESREAVERHLETCPSCGAEAAAMSGGEQPEDTAKEVDYLKRVKKSTFRKIALAVACTALVLVGGFLLKEFAIGRAPAADSISIELAQVDEDNNLTFLLDTYSGAYELRGLKSTVEDGVLSYTAREVRVNLFQVLFMQENIGSVKGYAKQIPMSIPLNGLTEVRVCGRTVWQKGMVIDRTTLLLLDARTPYCGDPAALGRLASILDVAGRVGPYTTSLQTSKRPYSWTMEFQERLDSRQISQITACDFLFLALVDNLDEALFTHPGPPGSEEPRGLSGMTAESANSLSLAGLVADYNAAHGTGWAPKRSIKHYADSPADLQRLIELLESFYGVHI